MNKIVYAGCAVLLAGSALCASIVGEYVGQGEAEGLSGIGEELSECLEERLEADNP